MNKALKRTYLGLILLFLYLPIAVLIFQSFNAGVSRARWEGFSLRWYRELVNNRSIMNALYVTLSIAVLAAIISTIMGTIAAIGIHAMDKRPLSIMMAMTNIPVVAISGGSPIRRIASMKMISDMARSNMPLRTAASISRRR